MAHTFAEYHDGFAGLELLVSEYDESWRAGEQAEMTARAKDKMVLLGQLSQVEAELASRTGALDASVRKRLDKLGAIIGYMDDYEKHVDHNSLARAKRQRREQRHARARTAREAEIAARIAAETEEELARDLGLSPQEDDPGLATAANRLDAAWRRAARASRSGDVPSDIQGMATATMDSIDELAKSRLPSPVARAVDALRLPFRERKYAEIAERRERLDELVARATDELSRTKAESQSEIDAQMLEKLEEIARSDEEMSSKRAARSEEYRKELKGLLLDGLEGVICPGSIYADAEDELARHLRATGVSGERLSLNAFCPGIAVQDVSAADDGTLDGFLSELMGDAYGRGLLLTAMTIAPPDLRALCTSYYAGHIDGIYPLFSNYALQFLDVFSELGARVFLCDRLNHGGGYADFIAYACDNIVIAPTGESCRRQLDELAAEGYWRQGLLERAGVRDIWAYNDSADEKLAPWAMFASSLSEFDNDELAAMTMLARKSRKLGLYVFAGVSTDELQESGVVDRSRANAVNALASVCDRIYMDSSGRLGLGVGRPAFQAPPNFSDAARTEILESVADGDWSRRSAKPLEPAGEEPLKERVAMSVFWHDETMTTERKKKRRKRKTSNPNRRKNARGC